MAFCNVMDLGLAAMDFQNLGGSREPPTHALTIALQCPD